MKDRLNRSNLGKAHTSGSKVDGKKLGHAKGLAVRFSPLKPRVAQLVLTSLDAVKEVLKGQVEPLNCLLERLGVGGLEKGMVLFQVFQAVVQIVPAEVRSVRLVGGFFGFQGPVVDEPTGTSVLVNAVTLHLVWVEAIPVGS